MKKPLIKFSVLAAAVAISAGGIAYSSQAFAKNQPSQKLTQVQMMSKYSVTNKAKAHETVRNSRVPQINIVTEAANVLNELPIQIIDEMKKGKTLEQVAQEKGLNKDQFLQKLTDYEDKTLTTASKQGSISKKHEDSIKQGQKQRLENSLALKSVDASKHQAMNMGQ